MGKIWNDYNWDFWNPQKEPLSKKAKKNKKISIFTTLGKSYFKDIVNI